MHHYSDVKLCQTSSRHIKTVQRHRDYLDSGQVWGYPAFETVLLASAAAETAGSGISVNYGEYGEVETGETWQKQTETHPVESSQA